MGTVFADTPARREYDVPPFDSGQLELSRSLSSADAGLREHRRSCRAGILDAPAAISSGCSTGPARDARPTWSAVPRGLALHITPANVDTMFLYSFAVSLLAGNLNVVRDSATPGWTTLELILGHLRAACWAMPRGTRWRCAIGFSAMAMTKK